jgi:hypothetical protein
MGSEPGLPARLDRLTGEDAMSEIVLLPDRGGTLGGDLLLAHIVI